MAEKVKRYPKAPPLPGMGQRHPKAPPLPGMGQRFPKAPPLPGMDGGGGAGGDPLDFDFGTSELTINKMHPDIGLTEDRHRIMGTMPPEAGAQWLRDKGYEVDHEGGFNYRIRKPGEKDWHRLDPKGLDWGDIGDILGDIWDYGGGAALTAMLGLGTAGGSIPASALSFSAGLSGAQAGRYALGAAGGAPTELGEAAADVATTAVVGGAADLLVGGVGRHVLKPLFKKMFPKIPEEDLSDQAIQSAIDMLPGSVKKKISKAVTQPEDFHGWEDLSAAEAREVHTAISTSIKAASPVDDPMRVVIEGMADATQAKRDAGFQPRDRTFKGPLHGFPKGLQVPTRGSIRYKGGTPLESVDELQDVNAIQRSISELPKEEGDAAFQSWLKEGESPPKTIQELRNDAMKLVAETGRPPDSSLNSLEARTNALLDLATQASTDPSAMGNKIALRRAKDIRAAIRSRGENPVRKSLDALLREVDKLRPVKEVELEDGGTMMVKDYGDWMAKGVGKSQKKWTDGEVIDLLKKQGATDDQVMFALVSPEERLAAASNLGPEDLELMGASRAWVKKATGLRRKAVAAGGRPHVDVVPENAHMIGVKPETIRAVEEGWTNWIHKEQPGYVAGKGGMPKQLKEAIGRGEKIFDEEAGQWRTITSAFIKKFTLEGGEDALEFLAKKIVGTKQAGTKQAGGRSLRGLAGKGLYKAGHLLEWPFRKAEEFIETGNFSGVMPGRTGRFMGHLMGSSRAAGILAGLTFAPSIGMGVLMSGAAGKGLQGLGRWLMKDPTSAMRRFLRSTVNPKARKIADQIINVQRAKGREAARVLLYMILQDPDSRDAILDAAKQLGIKLDGPEKR